MAELDGDGGTAQADEKYDYNPAGAPDDEKDSTPTSYSAEAKAQPFRFEGFYYDAGVKTYDMQARPYRPDPGRFNTPDRFEDSQADFNVEADPLTQDRYGFAGGNPVNNVEFDGHEPISSFTQGCAEQYGQHCHGPQGRRRRVLREVNRYAERHIDPSLRDELNEFGLFASANTALSVASVGNRCDTS